MLLAQPEAVGEASCERDSVPLPLGDLLPLDEGRGEAERLPLELLLAHPLALALGRALGEAEAVGEGCAGLCEACGGEGVGEGEPKGVGLLNCVVPDGNGVPVPPSLLPLADPLAEAHPVVLPQGLELRVPRRLLRLGVGVAQGSAVRLARRGEPLGERVALAQGKGQGEALLLAAATVP